MKKTILIAVVATLLSGCFKDKGNYDYADVNPATIVLPSRLDINLSEETLIEPEITFQNPDDTAGVTYEWREDSKTISTERNLLYRPTTPSSPGAHQLELYVTDRYGYSSRAEIYAYVTTVYKFGFAILSEIDGRSAISFVNRNTTTNAYTAFYDSYASTFPGAPLGTGPQRLSSIAMVGDELVVFQQSGAVSLSGTSLEKVVTLAEEFGGGTTPVEMIDYLCGVGLEAVLGSNGKVYTRVNSALNVLHSSYFMSEPQYIANPSTFVGKLLQVNPYANSMWMYDTGNNRLLALHSEAFAQTNNTRFYGSELTLTESGAATSGFASVNNLSNFTLIEACNYGFGTFQNRASFRNILKNGSGSYEVQSFTASKTSNTALEMTITERDQQAFAGSALVGDNTSFSLRGDGRFLFFAQGSKLWAVEFRTVGSDLTQILTEVHDFGKPIKLLARNDQSSYLSPTLAQVRPALGIAFESGDFCIMAVDDAALFSPDAWADGKLFESSQSMGNIVSVIWKYGAFSNVAQDSSW